MKITVDYNHADNQLIVVKDAKYIGDFAIRIQFNDGDEKLVDFKPFLNKSNHPAIKKYQNEQLFKSFKIIDGNLNWNNSDLIFPVSDLKDSKIDN